MSEHIQNRYEFVYLFDVKNGNPNGDPDSGNLPRIDPETSHGIVTDVCLKRKVRNFVEILSEREERYQKNYNIYIQERAVLAERRTPAYEAVKEEKKDKVSKARDWMCANFFDVRTFGAVMSTTKNNCGQVRGPVQFNFAESIDPVVPLEASITRMAVETEKEAAAQAKEGKDSGNRTMGRKTYIPYGLYRAHGYVSAPLAGNTGFSEDDLQLLWDALINMFDHDRSAARGEMAAQRLIVFKHDSELGNAPAHKLFELVTINRSDTSKPPRKFSDYEVSIDTKNVPNGVTLQERL
ncbi:MAG: type I-C CRISPR-associated protein Cas7/Csd2 [Candidatus Electrothrix sp. GW3-4]|uniref:type I-C CRISPR-associated protein Cas7/Csd2 n=1 Tax=Candidatus Electrothrix sp. GW3-4 TaxID=3126740 RepID=UPI0030CC419D